MFNFIKQLFGSRTRRAFKPVTLDGPVLLNRAVALCAVLSTGGTVAGLIPGHLGVAVTGILGLIASTGPGILSAAGLVRPVGPGILSATQAAKDVLDAPEAARKAAARDAQEAFVQHVAERAVQDYLLNKSGQFSAADLGKIAFGAAGDAAKVAEADIAAGAPVQAAPVQPASAQPAPVQTGPTLA